MCSLLLVRNEWVNKHVMYFQFSVCAHRYTNTDPTQSKLIEVLCKFWVLKGCLETKNLQNRYFRSEVFFSFKNRAHQSFNMQSYIFIFWKIVLAIRRSVFPLLGSACYMLYVFIRILEFQRLYSLYQVEIYVFFPLINILYHSVSYYFIFF